MPITTITQARDDILEMFTTAWNTNTPAITGTVPEVRYQGVEEASEPPTGDPWARVSVTHVTGTQSSMGETGNRNFEHAGIVTMQLFVPMEDDDGLGIMDQLIKVAVDAFEGECSTNGVWFRNVRVNEVGPDRPWFNVNVLADFEYRIVK